MEKIEKETSGLNHLLAVAMAAEGREENVCLFLWRSRRKCAAAEPCFDVGIYKERKGRVRN